MNGYWKWKRDDITYLQHLQKNINVFDGIIWPAAECIQHICSDLGENTENDIFKLKSINMGRVGLVLNRLFSPVTIVLMIFRWSYPSFPMTIMRLITSSPSRVHAARKCGFYLYILDKSRTDGSNYRRGSWIYRASPAILVLFLSLHQLVWHNRIHLTSETWACLNKIEKIINYTIRPNSYL